MASSSSANVTSASFRICFSRSSLKAITSVVGFIGKVGKELIFEIEPEKLTFRTLNDAKSAFTSISFEVNGHNEVFEDFAVTLPVGEEDAAFKLNVRPIIAILKNLKKVRSLMLFSEHNVTSGTNKVVFEMINENGMRRTHKFSFQDSEVVSAMFDEESSSKLSVEPKIFAQVLEHLHQTAGEIEIDASVDSFRIKSFHQEQAVEISAVSGLRRYMSTEMSLDTAEFDLYEYRSSEREEELVFCIKEVKAFLGLCEANEISDLRLFFSESGVPIKFSISSSSFSVFINKAGLVMATLERRQIHSQLSHAVGPLRDQEADAAGRKRSREYHGLDEKTDERVYADGDTVGGDNFDDEDGTTDERYTGRNLFSAMMDS